VRAGGLRAVVAGAGVALLLAGGFSWIAGCGPGAAWRLALPGLALFAALAVERWRYQRLAVRPPGRGFLATAERFIDPETGRPVTVYLNPETGERRYVDATAASERSTR
jgi:hypothetical protein